MSKFDFQRRFIRNIRDVSFFLLLTSCASVEQEPTPIELELQETVKSQQALEHNVPAEINSALLESSIETVGRAKEVLAVERFDVSVNQVPARTFFLSLVADSGVNVVAHPEIAGVISLELKNVTVQEVLDVTREVYGYEYKISNGIYTIYPRKLRTEIFAINYLDVQRVGVTDTSVLIGEISSESSQRNGGNSGSSSNSGGDQGANLLGLLDNDDGESSSGANTTGITPGARVQTLTKTDFWNGLHLTIMAIIGGDKEGRLVMTNPQSGLVVVTALPRELSSVREFLKKSELSVKRQVVLETKILEVRLNDEFEAGINWGAISGEINATQNITGTGDSPSGSYFDILFENEGQVETLFSSVFKVVDITKLIGLLEKQGNVQVLSSPRISTVNNQKAVIRVGSDEFFVTGVSNSTTSTAATVTSAPDIELGSFFSGIALDVTPQIAEDGEVILHIHPIVSDVQDQEKNITIGDNSFSIPLALRDIRESDSIVKAKSGEVVVLGGLMQETMTDIFGKRPILGDVPLVNAFFRTKQKGKVKTELVILMRPIVVQDDTWEREIARGYERVKSLSDEYRAR